MKNTLPHNRKSVHQTGGTPQHQKLDKLYDMGIVTINEGDEWPRYSREITRQDGQYLSDVWAYQPYTEGTVFDTDAGIDDDVRWMGSKDSERLGYPTQKPLGLLKRIIEASSEPGGVVLDPFCGCGTAVHAAESLKRKWIGIDVTHLAIQVIKDRLKQHFRHCEYDLGGVPTTVEGAKALAMQNKLQFEFWAVGHVGGQPKGYAGADRGIDGRFLFKSGATSSGIGLISVKGGKSVGPAAVRDLRGVIEREDAQMGVLICVEPPTQAMKEEAAAAGIFVSDSGDKYPRMQVLPLVDIFNGRGMVAPPLYNTVTVRDAARRGSKKKADAPISPQELLRQHNMLFSIKGGKLAKPQQAGARDESTTAEDIAKKTA